MASIEETLNRLREDNLKSIEDERLARERETSARLNLLQDEKSLLAQKKLNAQLEKAELQKKLKEAEEQKKTGSLEASAAVDRLTRELEKAKIAEKNRVNF